MRRNLSTQNRAILRYEFNLTTCFIISLLTLLFFLLMLPQSALAAEERVHLDAVSQGGGNWETDISGNVTVWASNNGSSWDVYAYDIATGVTTQVTNDLANQYLPRVSGNIVIWLDDRNGGLDIYSYNLVTGIEDVITQSSTAAWDRTGPAVDGSLIAWTDYRYGNEDIYAYDLNTGIETRISSNPGTEHNPSISGSKVVWDDHSVGYPDVFMYDFTTGLTSQLSNDIWAQQVPEIEGNLVVWEDWRNGSGDIYSYDLNTLTETRLTTNGLDNRRPDISGSNVLWEVYPLVGGPDIFMYDINTSSTSQLTNTFRLWDWAPSISGSKAVWMSDENGAENLYSYDLTTGVKTRITDNPPGQYNPAIDGTNVAWSDGRNGNYDVYVRDMRLASETRLTTDPSAQGWPGISGDFVVWEDHRNGSGDIYVYQLSTSSETRLTSDPADQLRPDVYGNNVVWLDRRNGDFDVYTYNLSTGVETRITSDPTAVWSGKADVYGTTIVWTDRRNGNVDVYAYDISTGIETQITSDPGTQHNAAIWGDTIVWDDHRNGEPDIYSYNLTTGVTARITNDTRTQQNPAIGGNKIAWEDNRDGNWEIYTYDLATSTEVRETSISTNQIKQFQPAISGDNVVWSDWRNGNCDIYGNFAPQPFNLKSPAAGATVWNNKPVFAWQPTVGIIKYQLYIDGSLNVDNIPPSSTSVQPASALSTGSHNWYLSAVDGNGNTVNSTSTRTVNIDPNSQTWAQVNLDGFGSAANNETWPIAIYDNKLYSGSMNFSDGGNLWETTDGVTWSGSVIGGWGGNSMNVGTWPRLVNGVMFGATQNPDGAEIWKFDGVNWNQSSSFNDPAMPGIDIFQYFNGHYFAAPWSTPGAKIWRSTDGSNWSSVYQGGSSTDYIRIGEAFNNGVNDYLYAGIGANGGDLIRTSNGQDWSTVTVSGPGGAMDMTTNPFVVDAVAFKGFLYINSAGGPSRGEIWRSPTGNSNNWTRVISSGFNGTNTGIPGNSLFVNGDYLYATARNHTDGAEIWRTTDGTTWVPLMTGGFGDKNNAALRFFKVFNSKLFVGAFNEVTGGQIWAMPLDVDSTPPSTTLETSPTTNDGLNGWFKTTPTIKLTGSEPGTTYYSWDSTTTWTTGTNPTAQAGAHTLYYYSQDTASNTEEIKSQVVKVDTSPWQQVSPTGFGDPNNTAIELNWQGGYKGQLYAFVGKNDGTAGIWRTTDGTNWTNTMVGGNPNHIGPAGQFFGYLYGWGDNVAGTTSLWRSTDGSNWSSVPLGISGGGAWVGIFYKGSVFAGTWDIQGGGRILRSTDGLNWISANDPGFGDVTKGIAKPSTVWKGYLYGFIRGSGNAKLYRTASALPNQADWSEVIINGDPYNTNDVVAVSNFKGYLYVANGNGTIWRTQDPGSSSGWTEVTPPGFGNPQDYANNYLDSGIFQKINNYLYVETANVNIGSRVWRTSDGINWEDITPAWNKNNIKSRHLAPFKGKLYVGTRNILEGGPNGPIGNAVGGEIWALPFNNTSIGNNVSPDLGSAATLTFSQVTSAGSTAVWTENWMAPAVPPAGHSFLETYYDFSTDVDYSGPITLTIPYDQTEATGSESNLKIMHWNETSQNWDAVSTTVDQVNNTVTGTTNSLSIFVVAEVPDLTPPSSPNLVGYSTTTNSVDLYWSGSTDNVAVTGYIVYDSSGTVVGDTGSTSLNLTGLTPGASYSYHAKAYDAVSNLSAASNMITITTVAKSGSSGDTYAGAVDESVSVSPTADIGLTFTDINIDGTTTVTEIVSAPTPPSSIQFEGAVYDINTTADFDPPITISIKYNPATISVPEEDLRLYHYEGGAWVDITTYVDTVNNMVVGEANSLSPFVIGAPAFPGTGVNTNLLIALSIFMIGAGSSVMIKRKTAIIHE